MSDARNYPSSPEPAALHNDSNEDYSLLEYLGLRPVLRGSQTAQSTENSSSSPQLTYASISDLDSNLDEDQSLLEYLEVQLLRDGSQSALSIDFNSSLLIDSTHVVDSTLELDDDPYPDGDLCLLDHQELEPLQDDSQSALSIDFSSSLLIDSTHAVDSTLELDDDPNLDGDLRLLDHLELEPLQDDSQSALSTDLSSSLFLDSTHAIASTSELVENTLEIISQDEDYMKRMGIHTRVTCAFCYWAGPKLLVEGHIRKKHADLIHRQNTGDWNMSFTLESLVQQRGAWLHRIVEHDSLLYMLSVRYEEPGRIVATLSWLSTELESPERLFSITLYNKISGEPFTWINRILDVPPDDNNVNSFRIDLAKLDLLPNSVLSKLIYTENQGDTESSDKVVVGHPALNNVDIIVFVKFH